jgi:hypothetical protein
VENSIVAIENQTSKSYLCDLKRQEIIHITIKKNLPVEIVYNIKMFFICQAKEILHDHEKLVNLKKN